MRLKTIGISFGLLSLSACSSQANIDMQSLIETQSPWKISTVNDKATLNAKSTMQFTDGRVSGSSGCNRFFANYQVKDAQIAFGPIGSTLMACPPELMQQESQLFQALAQPLDIHLNEQTVILSHGKESNVHLEPTTAE